MTIVVRTPVIEDATAMAKVHVETWQETYQGTMPDDVLFAPDSLQRREHMWNSLLAGGTSGKLTIAVAEHDRQLVGIAMSGPSDDEDRQGSRSCSSSTPTNRSTAKVQVPSSWRQSSHQVSLCPCGSLTPTRGRRRSTARWDSLLTVPAAPTMMMVSPRSG